MHQQQPPQVRELADGVVGRTHGLHSLAPRHADAHVRLLDHGDVVGAVTDREGQRRGHHVRLDEAHDVGLLQRRDTAGDYRCTVGDLGRLRVGVRLSPRAIVRAKGKA